MATIEELESLRWDLRRDCVDIIMAGAGGHIGGDMSVIDALMTLYANHLNISPETVDDPNRDRFVLSKGHAMEAYYAVLCHEGYLDLDDVKARFSKFGSPYIGHPNNKLKGIEMNSGSLGHGLPVAVGMALAGKMDGRDYRVYTIMGDGELAEGSVWEGAMSGGNYQLDNLCALVDRNRLQISGSTEDECPFQMDRATWVRRGTDVTLVATGEMVRHAVDAADLLAEQGISATVLDMYCVKPLDAEAVIEAAGATRAVVTVEEHSPFGGLGSMVAQVVGEHCPRPVKCLSLPDAPVITGTSPEVFAHYGLTGVGIAKTVAEFLPAE